MAARYARWLGADFRSRGHALEWISDDGIDRLAGHKYVSGAYTWLDNQLDPFWLGCARYFPRWISPNVISVIGCLCALISTVCSVMAGWCQSPPLYILSGVFILLYMNADAIDGKHARLTKQSTPLGALVDHGIDAFVAFTTGVAICATVDPMLSSVSLIAAFCAFHSSWFIAQWSELELGCLDARGITEGEIVAGLVLSLPGVVALDIYSWIITLPAIVGGPLPIRAFVQWAVFVSSAVSALYQLGAVMLGKGVTHYVPLLHLLLHNVASVVLAGTPLYGEAPLLVFTVVGMDACLLMTKIRFTASTRSPWRALHLELLPFYVLFIAAMIGVPLGRMIFLLVLVWQTAVFAYAWHNSVSRICKALGIPFLAQVPLK